MQLTENAYQNSKNRIRLISQNSKLYYQVQHIRQQIKLVQPETANPVDSAANQAQPIIVEQIALQEKLIRKLRAQVQHFKLERAKDNVEYIIREEDELKLSKKLELQLIDEKNILLGKKVDKSMHLQKDKPYQTYEKSFLQNLTEVVHFNREQGAKITEVQREIRKYHLMKKAKGTPIPKAIDPAALQFIEKEIKEKIQAKANLERQWKPHFAQMDEQYASLLKKLASVKQELLVLEKQQSSWEIRMSVIRESEDVISDKERIQKVNVNPKLRQKIADYIQNEHEKKKKKVNEEELKYQFMKKKAIEEQAAEEVKTNAPPPLPGIKKKEEKITQTMHNDKNITKKIDKNLVKKIKNDQNTLTDISVPASKNTTNKMIRKDSIEAKNKANNEQRSLRLWQNTNPMQAPKPKAQEKGTSKHAEPHGGLIHLKEIGMATSARLWKEEAIDQIVQ